MDRPETSNQDTHRGRRTRRRRHTHVLAAGVVILAALGGAISSAPGARGTDGRQAVPPTPPAAARSGDTAITAGLQAMHRGEYRRALDDFKQAADALPGSAGPLFYPVFARWWQGVFSDGPTGGDDPAFDEAYSTAVQVAGARLEEVPRDVDALATLGGSRILRAHIEAVRGNYWRAGQEARRGKKSLEQALAIDPARGPALFGMGALNYYADRVPLIVKGLRVLFFMPGGDAPLGLRQIRTVADGPGPLHTDGRLLLALVCSDHYQQAYDDALVHLRRALVETGGSSLIQAAIGDLQIRLARYDAAAATLANGMADSTADGIEASRQRRWLGLGLAEALAGDWRLDEAAAAIARADQEEAPASNGLRRVEGRLLAEIAARRAAMSGPEAAPADVAAGGEDDLLAAGRLLAGRRLLDAGRAAEAVPILESAADLLSHDPPAWLAGSIHLDLGLALKRSGNSAAAHGHFDKAIATRRFRAADRARLELEKKGEDAALCAP